MNIDHLIASVGVEPLLKKQQFVEENNFLGKVSAVFFANQKAFFKNPRACLVVNKHDGSFPISGSVAALHTLCGKPVVKLGLEAGFSDFSSKTVCASCWLVFNTDAEPTVQYLAWLVRLVKLDSCLDDANKVLGLFASCAKVFPFDEVLMGENTLASLAASLTYGLKMVQKHAGLLSSFATSSTEELIASYVAKSEVCFFKLQSLLDKEHALQYHFAEHLENFSISADEVVSFDFPAGTQVASLNSACRQWLYKRRSGDVFAARVEFLKHLPVGFFKADCFFPKEPSLNPADFADFAEYLRSELAFNASALTDLLLGKLEELFLLKSSFSYATQMVYCFDKPVVFERMLYPRGESVLLSEATLVEGVVALPRLLASAVLGVVCENDSEDVLLLACRLHENNDSKNALDTARLLLA